MCKINNEFIIRRIHYDNPEGLFWEIHNILDGLKETNKEIYSVKHLLPLSRTEVLAFYEQDLNKVLVEFYQNNKPILFDPYTDETITVMSFDEVNQIKSIGKVQINNITYSIVDTVFSITNKDYTNRKIIKFMLGKNKNQKGVKTNVA